MQPRAPLHSSVLVLAIAAAMAVPVAAPAQSKSSSGKTLYKWVDEKGVVHYGDSIPPQYAKKERHILNEHGVEVGKLEAEKTDAQRAVDDAKRQAVLNAKQRDQILLTTYVSVEQIEFLRDQRLDLLEGQVTVGTQYLENLNGRLNKLHSQAQAFKPYSGAEKAAPMPDQMAEDLVRALNEIRVQERNLAAKRSEQTNLRRQFQSDIERFRELKGIK